MIKIHQFQTLANALALMQQHQIRHLPVVDDFGLIVGMLSDRDVLRAMVPRRDEDAPDQVAYHFRHELLVRDFMSAPVHRVGPDLPVLEVIRKMRKEKISSYLVAVDDRHCVGIVTTHDMLELLAARLDADEKLNRLTLAEAFPRFAG